MYKLFGMLLDSELKNHAVEEISWVQGLGDKKTLSSNTIHGPQGKGIGGEGVGGPDRGGSGS